MEGTLAVPFTFFMFAMWFTLTIAMCVSFPLIVLWRRRTERSRTDALARPSAVSVSWRACLRSSTHCVSTGSSLTASSSFVVLLLCFPPVPPRPLIRLFPRRLALELRSRHSRSQGQKRFARHVPPRRFPRDTDPLLAGARRSRKACSRRVLRASFCSSPPRRASTRVSHQPTVQAPAGTHCRVPRFVHPLIRRRFAFHPVLFADIASQLHFLSLSLTLCLLLSLAQTSRHARR